MTAGKDLTLSTTHTTTTRVPVADLFYSFQGEGVNLGRRALFARLNRCNLTCGYPGMPATAGTAATGAMVCDTEYTWNTATHDLQAAPQMSTDEIWDALLRLDPATANPGVAPVDLIVVTGGEPLLHRDVVTGLAHRAAGSGRVLEIETNATVAPGEALLAAGVSFNAGLKLANSAVPHAKRIKPQVIAQLQGSGRARWKFVVTSADDVEEIAALQEQFGLTEVWLSPEGTSPEVVIARMRWLADIALARGWHLTTRQHVLIWGDERGR